MTDKTITVTAVEKDFPAGTTVGPMTATLLNADGTPAQAPVTVDAFVATDTGFTASVTLTIPPGIGYKVSVQATDGSGAALDVAAVSDPFDVVEVPTTVKIKVPVSVTVA